MFTNIKNWLWGIAYVLTVQLGKNNTEYDCDGTSWEYDFLCFHVRQGQYRDYYSYRGYFGSVKDYAYLELGKLYKSFRYDTEDVSLPNSAILLRKILRWCDRTNKKIKYFVKNMWMIRKLLFMNVLPLKYWINQYWINQ